MSFVFNPFTSNFDSDSAAGSFWKSPVTDLTALNAITTDTDGTIRAILNTNDAYRWNLGALAWQYVGKVKAGTFGASANSSGLSVGTDNTVTLQPADGTHPGGVSTVAQTLAGTKTFSNGILSSSIDTATATSLAIGTLNATTINIGNASSTVNIQGTVITETSSTLNVTNPVFTVNSGGVAGSASNSGMQVNENNIITGYVETSADRNSWIAKAPNTAGIVTLTPGAGGIILNQSSHDPVTLTAVGSTPNANAASLSTQALTLQPADGSNPGVITAGTQTIGGAKTFSSAITGSLTGAASLNVLKAGDTMTGALTMPAGLVGTPSVNFGTSGTGFWGPSSSSVAMSSAGTEVARLGTNGLSINTTTNDAALHLKNILGTDGGGITQESNTGLKWTFSAVNNYLGLIQGSNVYAIFQTGWAGIGPQAPAYPFDFNVTDAANDPSVIAPNSGTHNFPTIVVRNINSTANTITGVTLAGSSKNPMGGMYTTHEVQTAGSETAHLSLYVANSGVFGEGLRIKANKTIQAPGYTAGALVTDSSGNISTTTNMVSTGDIKETSFSAANNQAVAANVTGLAFANATVRSFQALVSVYINAASSLYEVFTLNGIQRGSDWQMSVTSTGDASGIVFSLTSAGQVQYTSANTATWTSTTMKFRAITTSV